MFHQTIFSYLKLCIQQRTQETYFFDKAVILSSTHNNFFATIATLCNNMPGHCK